MKPRLLIILNRFVIGGQAVDTIPLAWYLKKDLDVLIVFGEKEKDEIEAEFLLKRFNGLRFKKIKQLRRSLNPFLDVFVFFKILFTIVAFKPLIVHTHGAKSGFIGRLAAWVAGVPVIVHTFHGHFFHSYFSKKVSGLIAMVERCICKITTRAIALSETQQIELSQQYKILPLSKLIIIPLGFSPTSTINSKGFRSAFREKYRLKADDVAIGIVGRIVSIKNHSFFIDVIREIAAVPALNPCAFFIIGDGELRSEVERELKDKRISFNYESVTSQSRVILTSWLTNIDEFMSGLDVIALTSLNEGTPLSIIEAEFYRKPVISTNVGGVKDTMVDGVTGFLIDNHNVSNFSKKLRALINSNDLRTSMGNAGFHFAATNFSKNQEVERTKQLYIKLLREKGYLEKK